MWKCGLCDTFAALRRLQSGQLAAKTNQSFRYITVYMCTCARQEMRRFQSCTGLHRVTHDERRSICHNHNGENEKQELPQFVRQPLLKKYSYSTYKLTDIQPWAARARLSKAKPTSVVALLTYIQTYAYVCIGECKTCGMGNGNGNKLGNGQINQLGASRRVASQCIAYCLCKCVSLTPLLGSRSRVDVTP